MADAKKAKKELNKQYKKLKMSENIGIVKGVLIAPSKSLTKYLSEKTSQMDLFKMSLSTGLITFASVFIGLLLAPITLNWFSFSLGAIFQTSLLIYLSVVLGPIAGSLIMPELDKSFLKLKYSKEDWTKILNYTFLPYLASGIFYLLPTLGRPLRLGVGLYTAFILYSFLTKEKKVKQEEAFKAIATYGVIALVVSIAFRTQGLIVG